MPDKETNPNINDSQESKDTDMDSTSNDFTQITNNLSIMRGYATELALQVEDLEKRLATARGTGDHTEKARLAAQLDADQPTVTRTPTKRGPGRFPKHESARDRVLKVLQGHTLSTAHVSKQTGISIRKVETALNALKEDGLITNIGSESFTSWCARIGDHTAGKELSAEVRRLISAQPMTMQQLVDATGARVSRISGAIVFMQRTEGSRMLNLGSQRRARWLLIDDSVKTAALQPKTKSEDPEF